MRRRSEKYVKGSEYVHRIGLYLSFHLNWVLGPFFHGRLQILQTSEVTFTHVITPLSYKKCFAGFPWPKIEAIAFGPLLLHNNGSNTR